MSTCPECGASGAHDCQAWVAGPACCRNCHGYGDAVVGVMQSGHAITMLCRTCGGSGVDPARCVRCGEVGPPVDCAADCEEHCEACVAGCDACQREASDQDLYDAERDAR